MIESRPNKPPRSNVAHRLVELGDVVLADEAALGRHAQWRDFYRSRIGLKFDEKLIFEIGCGNADFLARIAQLHPTTAFVGLDWKYKSIFNAGRRARDLQLNNLAFIRGRGQDISRIFSAHELDEVWLFHPDPSARPKELPNRIINDSFMIDLHAAIRPHASFCFKTDHAGYFQWILALLDISAPKWFGEKVEGAPKIRPGDLLETNQLPDKSKTILDRFKLIHHSPDFWNDPRALELADHHLFGRTTTPFESRFVRKRLPIYFVELKAQ